MSSNTQLEDNNRNTGYDSYRAQQQPEGTTPAQYDLSLVGDGGQQDYPRGSGAGTYLLFLPMMPIYLFVIYKFIIQQDLEPTTNMGVTGVIRSAATKETQI